MGGKKSKNQVIKLKFTKSELGHIKEAFDIFDKDKDGKITMDEVGFIMEHLNCPVTEEELLRIMDEVDVEHSGLIDFGEFLIAVTRYKGQIKRDHEIRTMFNVLDVRQTGKITAKDLKIAMAKIGEDFTDEDIEDMMVEADRNKDGVIDFKEFRALCFRLNL